MITFKQVNDLKAYLNHLKVEGETLAFVPTMGALHKGHISLVKKAQNLADKTLVSIFVNPTQFNEASDLEKYPRTLDADMIMLEDNFCDLLFVPSVAEIYPSEINEAIDFDLQGLDTVMEGKYRPGHFKGVLQVIKRFLEIIEPHYLVMGQKDFQQFAVVNALLAHLESPTQLVMGETKRENDGLAMSSRNTRLNPSQREIASLISRVLHEVKEKIGTMSVADLTQLAKKKLDIPAFKLDYFEIADANTLQAIDDIDTVEAAVACTAVYLGDIRLIDNVKLK